MATRLTPFWPRPATTSGSLWPGSGLCALCSGPLSGSSHTAAAPLHHKLKRLNSLFHRRLASGNGPELLELGKEVLDEVARLVEVFVESARRLAGCARWDHRRLAGFSERLEHPLVRIERLVGNERLGLKVGQQGIGSSQIVLLTPGEMKAGRIAERIDGGVDFRAQPSARAPDGLILTPLFTCSRAVLVGAHDGGV